jgi:hypothetical protein
MKKASKKEIEDHYKNELNDFMNQFGIESINFGKHKLKRKPKSKDKEVCDEKGKRH